MLEVALFHVFRRHVEVPWLILKRFVLKTLCTREVSTSKAYPWRNSEKFVLAKSPRRNARGRSYTNAAFLGGLCESQGGLG
jgi:hypothetical protein